MKQNYVYVTVGIVAGSGGALVIVISILAIIVRRLHRKSYPQPCYPAPPTSGPASSVSERRHSEQAQWSRDDGRGGSHSDLSLPGSVSSLFPKQSLRDFQLLRGYHPRSVLGNSRSGAAVQGPCQEHHAGHHRV